MALVSARLAVSVIVAATRARAGRDDPYTSVSEAPAWAALERLDRVHPRFADAVLREACGLPPLAHGPKLAGLARADRRGLGARPRPAARAAPRARPGDREPVPRGGPGQRPDGGALAADLRRDGRGRGRVRGRPLRRDARDLPLAALRRRADGRSTSAARCTWASTSSSQPGAVVRAPLAGVVHVLREQPRAAGLRAARDPAPRGSRAARRSSRSTATSPRTRSPGLRSGQRVEKGPEIARVGAPPSNGDWPPHLHFQLILDLLEQDEDFPGVALPEQRRVFEALSPDPNLLLRIPMDASATREPPAEETLAARQRLVGPSLRLSYARPLKIVRGFRQYLYDDAGRAYLDVYNNVPLVGHSHPRVVRAAQQQLALLNTNTRYLHELLVRYARRLTRLLPEPLRVCYFVNSGSEANELALRLARAATGGARRDRARARLPRAHHDARGREPVQVPGPGRDAGSASGCTWRRCPTAIAGATGATTRRRGRSTRTRSAGSRAASRARAGAWRRSCRRRCRASRARWCSRPGTWPTPTATCARPGASRSPTRCRPASAAWATRSGASRRRTRCRTSWCSASRSPTASRSARW